MSEHYSPLTGHSYSSKEQRELFERKYLGDQQEKQNKLLLEQNKTIEKSNKETQELLDKKNRLLEDKNREDKEKNELLKEQNKLMEEQNELLKRKEEQEKKKQKELEDKIRKDNINQKSYELDNKKEDDEKYYNELENIDAQLFINKEILKLDKKVNVLNECLKCNNVNEIKEKLTLDIDLLKEFIINDYSMENMIFLIKANINQLNENLKELQNKRNYYSIVNFLLREDIITYTLVEDYEKYDSTIDYKNEIEKVIDYENKIRKEKTEEEYENLKRLWLLKRKEIQKRNNEDEEVSLFVSESNYNEEFNYVNTDLYIIIPNFIKTFEDENLDKLYIIKPKKDNIEIKENEEYEVDEIDELDNNIVEVLKMIIEEGEITTSKIQKEFEVGYARAGRIIDQLENLDVITGYEVSKPRKIIKSKEEIKEIISKIEKGVI